MSKFQSLKVSQIIQETPDAITVCFEKPADGSFDYKPGQYLTLKLEVKGESIRRAYSLCSSPVTDSELAVTVKRVEHGLASNFLADQCKAGDMIEVLPPMGNFCITPDASNKKHYILIGAGSGITPLMSIIKTVLEVESGSAISLLYGNRNETSIIFKKELDALCQKYPQRLRVQHCLSQPSAAWTGLSGRLDRHKILMTVQELINSNPSPKSYWNCGPAGLMEEAQSALGFLGIQKKDIHRELFTAPLPDPDADAATSSASPQRGTYDVKVILDGDEQVISVKADESILDVAIEKGIDPPYACQLGICTTCRAKCLTGKIEMDETEGLSDAEIEEGYVLTCQAHPLTPDVTVEYG